MIIFAAAWILILPHHASGALPAEKPAHRINITPLLEFLEDPAGKMELSDVLNPNLRLRFRPVRTRQLDFGITGSIFWLRLHPLSFFEARNASVDSQLLVEIDRAWLPVARLWVPVYAETPAGTDRWRQLEAMTSDQSGRLGFPGRNAVFMLPKRVDPHRPMFLIMASSGPPLNMSVYMTSLDEYRNRMAWEILIFGLIYGVLGAMILYNALLYLVLHDRTYLLYVLYISTALLYQSSSYGHMGAVFGLDPASLFFLLYMFSAMSILFAAWFTKAFLQTQQYAPVMDKALSGLMVLAGAWMLLGLSGFYLYAQVLGSIAGILFPLAVIAAAVQCLRQKFRPARYFLIAWSVLAAGILVWSLRGIGMLSQSAAIIYSMPAATALEAILLSIALADRIRVLQKEKRRLETRERRLLDLSHTDGLTRLYNKRYFDEKLNSEIHMARHLGHPITLLILDLDDFKKVNDTFGHLAGDRVLEGLGRIMTDSARENDCACRYGGEEFALILPGAKTSEAKEVAERIRSSIAAKVFTVEGDNRLSATVSIGIGELQPGDSDADLIKKADEALYRAKAAGKNRVMG